MRIRLALVLALLPSSVARSQDVIDPAAPQGGDGTEIVVQPKRSPGSPTDLRPTMARSTIEIDSDACRYAAAHTGGADYKPGVDADGNSVMPADLPSGGQIQLPPRLAIPITTNIARMLHVPASAPLGNIAAAKSAAPQSDGGIGPGFRAEAYVGVITVENGALSFNGQPIGDENDAGLAAACRSAGPSRGAGAQ